MYALLVVLPLLAVVGIYAAIVRDRAKSARFARIFGLASLAALEGLVALFIIGETMEEPGGTEGAGMVAAWLLPAVALSLFALWRPDPAVTVLAIFAGLSVTLGLINTGWPGLFRDFQDQWGPVIGVIGLATGIAVTVLAFRRLEPAALLLLLLGVVPSIAGVIGNVSRGIPWTHFGSSEALAAPMVIGGILLLLAVGLAHERVQPEVRSKVGV